MNERSALEMNDETLNVFFLSTDRIDKTVIGVSLDAETERNVFRVFLETITWKKVSEIIVGALSYYLQLNVTRY